MVPPSRIMGIVRPRLLSKVKEVPIRAALRHIGSLCIARCILVNPLSVQPFMKGTAMIKHAVQNHLHPATVNLFHQSRKKGIAGIQILLLADAADITGSLGIIRISRCETLSFVQKNHAVMRVDIVVILTVILMIGRRHKQRIEINHFNSEIL